MLDLRLYRAAFLPVILAIVVVAFSLQTRPRPIETTLAPDAFLGARAARLLDDLAQRYPSRRPGSAGDMGLAGAVERTFRATGFEVSVRDTQARTIDGERTVRTVVAERPGRASSRLVVIAHRDAAGSPAAAELSGTAALMELARVYEGRTTRRTLTLVSTSGGSGGDAGASDWADHVQGPVDAVIVLGDVGGAVVRRPQVVGWSNGRGVAPQRLLRTVEQAVRDEASPPGASSPPMQALRLAFPLTVSEQGVIGARGLPAVFLGASGELGPPADAPVSSGRMESMGRALLRSLTALDNGPELRPAAPQSVVVVRNQVLPEWAVRLLCGMLLLPPLVAALDGLFRVRRRREAVLPWIGWTAAWAAPLLALTVVLVLLRIVGLVDAPAAPVRPGVIGVSFGVLAVAILVLAGGLYAAGRLAGRRLALGPPGTGAAAAVGLVAIGIAGLVWLRNPYAALFLLPAAHLWLLAVAPETRGPRWVRFAMVAGGLVPLALAALAYGVALRADPLQIAWMGILLLAGGHVGVIGVLLWSVVGACAVAALVVVARTPRAPAAPRAEQVRSRGPLTYAGPGSLGGTDSALRR